MSQFTQAVQIVFDPIIQSIKNFLVITPQIIGALLIATLGYFIAKFLGLLTKNVCDKLKIDQMFKKTGRHEAIGHMQASQIISGMVKWYIFAIFLIWAVTYIQIDPLAQLLYDVASWIPKLIVSVLIILIGLIVADFAGEKLAHAHKIKWVKIISPVAKFMIILFFFDAALRYVGIDITLAQSTYLIILGGFVLTTALIFGIAFGFALRKEAEYVLKKVRKKF